MGNANTVKNHIEHGQKSGVCQLASMNLNHVSMQIKNKEGESSYF